MANERSSRRVQDGVVRRSEVTYAEISNTWWKVTTDSTTAQIGTNTQTVTREQLTGLVDGLRSRETTDVKGGAKSATERVFDPVTGLVTETATSSAASPVVTESFCGIETKRIADGELVASTYDAFGRCVGRARCPQRAATQIPFESYIYNPLGDLSEAHTFTNGTDTIIERYAYDMLGRRVSTINALGDETLTAYDANGNVIAESGATYPVRYAYDSQNRRVAMWTNRSGDEWDMTRWAYDPATGLCTSKTYADGSEERYVYAADGKLLQTIYPNGERKENSYDNRGLLAGVSYSQEGSVGYSITYDVFCNVNSASDAAGRSWVYAYDASSHLIGETVVAGVESELMRFVDETGRAAGWSLSIADTKMGGVSYAYDTDGLLSSLKVTNSVGRALTIAYSYQNGYNVGYGVHLPSGTVFTREVVRDAYRKDWLVACRSEFSGAILAEYAYSRDAVGKPVSRNGDSFGYNARAEVVRANVAGLESAYDWDGIGNAISYSQETVTNYYEANCLNQYTVAPIAVSYDDNGNAVRVGEWVYSFDGENRMTLASPVETTNGSLRVRNVYDYRNRRIAKTVERFDGSEWFVAENRDFIYDGWNLIFENRQTFNGTEVVTNTVEYFWGTDISDSFKGAGGIGGLVAVSRNGVFYLPVYDDNGNVMKYVDEAGNIVAEYAYDAFGRIIQESGSLASEFAHRFSTKYFDSETGMSDFGRRFYVPDLRRWLNRDPMGEHDSQNNLYRANDNCAVCAVDFLGLTVIINFGSEPNRVSVIKKNGVPVGNRATTKHVDNIKAKCVAGC